MVLALEHLVLVRTAADDALEEKHCRLLLLAIVIIVIVIIVLAISIINHTVVIIIMIIMIIIIIIGIIIGKAARLLLGQHLSAPGLRGVLKAAALFVIILYKVQVCM